MCDVEVVVQVSDVSPRSALIHVTPVVLLATELVDKHLPDAADVSYELLLLDKSRESKYSSVYRCVA